MSANMFWPALAGELPSSDYATFDVRNNHPLISFPDTGTKTIFVTGQLPASYDGGNIHVRLFWAAATATQSWVFHGDSANQFSSLSVDEVAPSDTDNGILYWTVTPAGADRTLSFYKDDERTELVATATILSNDTEASVVAAGEYTFSGRVYLSVTGGALDIGTWNTLRSNRLEWAVAIERQYEGSAFDLDIDDFAAAANVTSFPPLGDAGSLRYTDVVFSAGAMADHLAAGDLFRLKISRLGDSGPDVMSGDAHLAGVALWEASGTASSTSEPPSTEPATTEPPLSEPPSTSPPAGWQVANYSDDQTYLYDLSMLITGKFTENWVLYWRVVKDTPNSMYYLWVYRASDGADDNCVGYAQRGFSDGPTCTLQPVNGSDISGTVKMGDFPASRGMDSSRRLVAVW